MSNGELLTALISKHPCSRALGLLFSHCGCKHTCKDTQLDRRIMESESFITREDIKNQVHTYLWKKILSVLKTQKINSLILSSIVEGKVEGIET